MEPTTQEDLIAREIVDAALAVHKALGPGLLESIYEQCLGFELTSRALAVERQVALPVRYRGHQLDGGFRLDLLVGRSVVVEIKTIEKVLPVHEAQILSYLRLSGYKLGLLINFNVALIKHGIRRYAQTS